ncbi:MAG: DNA polymerase, partial [Gammaproteobacteria bacterium]
MSDTSTAPLVLVDGSSYLFRAFHALPPLTTTRGQQTGAVKGVINMVRALIKQYPQSRIAVVFDAKGKTFRDDIYPEYKAHRPPMPQELASQIEPIHALIRAMGLPLLIVDGVEADDVIGTLAKQAWEKKIPTLVSTGDKDMTQLVNDHVTLLNTMTNETLDRDGVIAKFGLPPERIIEYLALMGDSVDNIPGIPGVGPKTAVKWLLEYGTLANLVAKADTIKGKAGENLRANLEALALSEKLATIKCDVELGFGPEDLQHTAPDKSALLTLYKALEFKGWVKELEAEGVTESESAIAAATSAAPASATAPITAEEAEPAAPTELRYDIITTREALQAFVAELATASHLALVIETDGAHYKFARIVGMSLSIAAGRASYIPLGHDMLGAEQQLPLDQVIAALKPALERKDLFKIGHDLKHASHVLLNHGVQLRGRRFDVMLMSYVLNSVAHKHTLERLCKEHLEFDLPLIDELLGKGRNKLTFSQVEIAKAGNWCATCADNLFRLQRILAKKLKETGQLADVYRYFEIPLVPVLTRMEENGIRVDVQVLGKQSQELAVRLQELEREALPLAGEEFNLGSPAQLQKILYDKLGCPVLGKTATGQPSTAESVLQELAETYPLPRVILEHRGLAKLKSTYTDKLPLEIHPETKRI